jgi:hypothetical protein
MEWAGNHTQYCTNTNVRNLEVFISPPVKPGGDTPGTSSTVLARGHMPRTYPASQIANQIGRQGTANRQSE